MTCKRHVTVCLAASHPPPSLHPTHHSFPRQKQHPDTDQIGHARVSGKIWRGRQGKGGLWRGDSPASPRLAAATAVAAVATEERQGRAPSAVGTRAERRRGSGTSAVRRGSRGRAPPRAGDRSSSSATSSQNCALCDGIDWQQDTRSWYAVQKFG